MNRQILGILVAPIEKRRRRLTITVLAIVVNIIQKQMVEFRKNFWLGILIDTLKKFLA